MRNEDKRVGSQWDREAQRKKGKTFSYIVHIYSRGPGTKPKRRKSHRQFQSTTGPPPLPPPPERFDA
jgi:hypothetical protein